MRRLLKPGLIKICKSYPWCVIKNKNHKVISRKCIYQTLSYIPLNNVRGYPLKSCNVNFVFFAKLLHHTWCLCLHEKCPGNILYNLRITARALFSKRMRYFIIKNRQQNLSCVDVLHKY